jgi:hypothetical protein
MTLVIVESLRKIAVAQLKVVPDVASRLGQNLANELTGAYQELLKALDDAPIEEKPTSVFGERLFKAKAKKKSA